MNKNAFLRTLTFGLILAVLAGLALSAFSFQTGKAATAIVVNSTVDKVSLDGLCTLREAIINANRDKALFTKTGECAAGSGADTITLPGGTYILTRLGYGDEDNLNDGDLDVNGDLTINGAGPGKTIINTSAFTDIIFHILKGKVSISGVTIRGGNPSGDGGAINNLGNLTLKNVVITNNQASGRGAGIYNASTGTLVVSNSTISSNTAKGAGGGIFNDGGTVKIANSTLSGNVTKLDGGGLYNNKGTVNLNNATITNNTADNDKNGSGDGGGIFRKAGSVTIENTILSGNFDGSSTTQYPDCAGALNSTGYNLVQTTTGCTISGTLTGNITGVSANLGPLQDNGGPTPTHALQSGSPAINAGSPTLPGSGGNACEATDQRGTARPQGPTCDIGAYEQVFVPTPALSLSKQISTSNGGPWSGSITVSGNSPVYYQFTVTNTGNVPLSSISVTDPNLSTSSCTFSNPLAIGATTSCVVGPVTAAPGLGTYTNTATASGGYSSQTVTSSPSSANYVVNDAVQTGPVYNITAVFDVTTTGTCTQGNCSLRDAILAANSKTNGSSPDEIHFNLPGNGPFTIQLSGPLPAITDPVIIDGYTQPGASQNTLEVGSNAVLKIVLDGASAGANAAGLTIQASNSKVCGLTIQNFSGDGITINGSNVTVCGNQITHNGGAGVRVSSGSSDTITGNVISANTGGGIVLATGTNNNQAAPTLTVSSVRVADNTPSTDVGGVLSGTPNTTYRIETFNNATCSGAQGDAILTSTTLTTDANGNGNFLVNVKPAVALGAGVTSTATGADGSTSTFSTCGATQSLNDSWLVAQPLSFNGGQSSNPVSQKIYQAGQTRWFKFPVLPGANVQVTVNSVPGTMVTLHRDLFKIYNQLIAPTNASALSANDVSGGYLPGSYLPGSYLPGSYLPGSYLPGSYLPGGILPGSYLPGSYLPGSYLPGSYLPGSYLPGSYLPGSYLTFSFLPGSYLPELYSGAIRRGLIAIANDQNATTQTILRNTFDLSEDLYVMVSGPASLADSFNLQVTVENGVCANVSPLPDPSPSSPVIAGSQPATGSRTTLIVWDSNRMLQAGSPQADVDTLRNKLNVFAARTEVNGIVIDMATVENGSPKYPRVLQANQTADTNTACITAKNAAAVEIKRVIDAYRAANSPGGTTTLQYIVLVGSDYEIPFFRYPDQAGLANEDAYVPPVATTSASEASLRKGQVLGQDAYGTQVDVTRSGFTIPVPQQAVGRLVRTAAEVSGMLDAYSAANGLVTPGSALVTGYDFVADAATKVQNEFYQGLNPANCASQPGGCLNVDSLIQPQASGLTGAWTADDLRNKILPASGNGSNLIFFAGHFSAGSVLAADYTTSMYSNELVNSPVDYTNSLIFALGCHSGYNIPALDALTYSPVPDWAEAFATKKATLVAATGYAYGDTVLTEYGEQLFLQLSQQLRTGNGPVAIGQALVNSKRLYMAQHPSLEGIDDKTILETTLYGLPMLKVNLPGVRINSSQNSIVSSASPVTGGPGASLGLQIGQPATGGTPNQVQVASTLTRQDVPLTNTTDNSTVTTTFFSGTFGDTIARPAEPIFPLDFFNIGVNGMTLRGVGFRGGSYADVQNVTPLTSAATTENSRAHPGFFSDFFYPLQNWAGNYFGAIDNGAESLIITPAQYRSNSLSSPSGTMRTYSNMAFRLYYLDKSWTNSSSTVLKAAAVAAGPYIHDIAVQDTGGGNLHFQAIVESDPAAGVQEVWVSYTSITGAWYGSWRSLDLNQNAQNSKLWEGNLILPQGVSLSDLSYFLQAANGAGTVSLVDPSLKTSTGAVPPPVVNKQTTQILLNPTDVSDHSGASGLVTATLQDAHNQPISERTVVFVVRDTSGAIVYTQTATTNYLGQALLGMLNLPRGDYSLTVYFLIDPTTGQPVDQSFDDYFGSQATGAIHLLDWPAEATNDSYTTNENTPLTIDAPGVLANDTDKEGDMLTATVVNVPSHGTLTLNADGSFTYTPDQSYSGGDSFTYVANDGTIDSNVATVSLNITPVNHAPDCSLAVPDTAWLWPPNNKFKAVKILGVTDIDGDPITIVIDGVYQDEPVGTKNSAPDAKGIGTNTVNLRAERDGSGDGRVYHIFFTASDGRGGTCRVDINSTIQVRVGVAHDQGNGNNPIDMIDGGALYDSTEASP